LWLKEKGDGVLPLLQLHGVEGFSEGVARPSWRGDGRTGVEREPPTPEDLDRVRCLPAPRLLADRDYVHLWSNGMHFTIRAEKGPAHA